MNASATIIDNLSRLVDIDIVVAPTAENLVRHTRDYNVEGNPAVGILALTFPRKTEQVSKILRYCNEHRIGVQPQGGMTGLSGGGVPVGPCVIIGLERMRTLKRAMDPNGILNPGKNF
jgi:FAD/FMN-containing dehydrogenase